MSGWQIALARPLPLGKPERLYVSLNRRGEFVINPAAWRWLGETANVTLLYDEERSLIGIKYPVAIDRNFFRVRRYGRGKRQRIVRAQRMISQFGISINRTLVFTSIQKVLYDQKPMLLLDLKTVRKIDKRRSFARYKLPPDE
ncbi:MAG TPA: hypothetical protein PLP21_13240 [Pyrinomonadaceae bacterium]|nr:hypothetical protein [Acidobacteriota bacterium]HQZ97280.1 hypothetical protein [Pyrinomonadaceae bacterium]